MAYLYRHIRLDKNEPFYIGISASDNLKRAYDVKPLRRNRIFNGIVAKTECEVEILFDDLTWEQACEKEKEFIILYGRKDLKTGTLANMSGGGEGSFGVIITEEQRKVRSANNKGRIPSLESRKKNSEYKIKYYKEHPEAVEKFRERVKKMPVDYELLKRMSEGNRIPIVQLTMDGEFIKEYESSESTRKDGFTPCSVTATCRGKYKHHKNFKFVYLKNYKNETN
jgi:hypothetical protein